MILAASGKATTTVMEKVGPNIISHVSNTYKTDYPPILKIDPIMGIDFSITKHVLMLWLVALIVSVTIIIPTRRYLSSGSSVPSGWMNAIEAIVKFIRDSIAKPNVGEKWVMTWAPVLLTFFFFILFANGIGMVPIFDVLGSINRFIIGVPYSDKYNTINTMPVSYTHLRAHETLR